MAKEVKKLELYEILAAKKAKGKIPIGFEGNPAKPANFQDSPTPNPAQAREFPDSARTPGVIVDDSLAAEFSTFSRPAFPAAASARQEAAAKKVPEPKSTPEPSAPPPPPRPRTPREVVFALDTAFVFFTIVLALVGSSYFLGYKRGQEERPIGMSGVGDIDETDPARINLRNMSPAPRATIRPPEQDFTLILRTEPATDDLPERLEMELGEAVARGRQETGEDIQGFIFRTSGADPRYVLSVGLGRTVNDADLNRLLQIYNRMEGITLSREPRPYIGCRIAPVRELGVPVY